MVVACLCAVSAVKKNTDQVETDQIWRAVVLVVDSIDMVTMHLAVEILVSMVILDPSVIVSRA